MNKIAYLIVLVMLVLSGCAANKDNTLASLGETLPVKIKKDAVIVSARQKAMDNYWDFMRSAPEDSLRVEAMRRLADLELEKSEEQIQRQIEQIDEQPANSPAQDIDLTEVSYEKAISLYEAALAVSKKKDGVEDRQVLYQISKAYEQVGKPNKALDALNRLLTQHPDVDNRDEIHFRRGELLFSLNQYRLAELAYTQAMVVNPSSTFYEKALSQKGWAAYKQGRYDQALYSFLSLADRKLRDVNGRISNDDSHLGKGGKELMRDIFRAVVLSFNEKGGPEAIGDYFNKHGARPYEVRIYKEMGDQYLDQDRIRDSAKAYKAFVKRYPDHPMAPDFDLAVIDAYTRGGYASLITEAKVEFAQRYRVNGHYWGQHGAQVHSKLMPVIKKNMEDLARHFHAQAQKTKQPKDFTQAMLWYRNYIKSFPETEKSAEMNFLLAETLFDNQQYELATKEYEKTAYQYPKSGKNAEAGYAALVAYDERSNQLQGKKKEIWDRLAIGSALRFGKTFPDDPRAAKAVTKAAEDLFALKKYNQAAVAARTILELTSKTTKDMQRTAWLIVAQSEFQNRQYTKAEAAFKIALTMVKDEKTRQSVQKGLAASIYKRGEQLKETGDFKGAVMQFARVSDVAPGTDIAVSADFDIAANLIAQENWMAAIPKLLSFRKKYPEHLLQEKVTRNLAAAYLKTNNPSAAAGEIEILELTVKDREEKRAMRWQIAELYEQAGQNGKVKAAYREYLQEYPTPLEPAIEARQKLANIYKQDGDIRNYYYWLNQIVQHDKDAGPARTDRTKYLAAKATLVLARPKLEMFNEVQLVAPLKQNLGLKKKRMQAAVDAYTTAANYGIAEVTTASIYRLAEIYNAFGRELLKSERPTGLSAEEREQYDILLEEQAYPFEEKSIDIHETNAQRVKDGMYDQWVKKSFSALSALRPVKYGKLEKSELVADGIL